MMATLACVVYDSWVIKLITSIVNKIPSYAWFKFKLQVLVQKWNGVTRTPTWTNPEHYCLELLLPASHNSWLLLLPHFFHSADYALSHLQVLSKSRSLSLSLCVQFIATQPLGTDTFTVISQTIISHLWYSHFITIHRIFSVCRDSGEVWYWWKISVDCLVNNS